MRRVPVLGMLAVVTMSAPLHGQQRGTAKTKIVVLGTGNPAPNPATMGPSIAVVVNGTPYACSRTTGGLPVSGYAAELRMS